MYYNMLLTVPQAGYIVHYPVDSEQDSHSPVVRAVRTVFLPSHPVTSSQDTGLHINTRILCDLVKSDSPFIGLQDSI